MIQGSSAGLIIASSSVSGHLRQHLSKGSIFSAALVKSHRDIELLTIYNLSIDSELSVEPERPFDPDPLS